MCRRLGRGGARARLLSLHRAARARLFSLHRTGEGVSDARAVGRPCARAGMCTGPAVPVLGVRQGAGTLRRSLRIACSHSQPALYCSAVVLSLLCIVFRPASAAPVPGVRCLDAPRRARATAYAQPPDGLTPPPPSLPPMSLPPPFTHSLSCTHKTHARARARARTHARTHARAGRPPPRGGHPPLLRAQKAPGQAARLGQVAPRPRPAPRAALAARAVDPGSVGETDSETPGGPRRRRGA